jgi:hypothetical protein
MTCAETAIPDCPTHTPHTAGAWLSTYQTGEMMLETLETLVASESPQGQAMLREKRQRLADIRVRERKEAEKWMKSKCTDIREKVYEDLLEARIYIDEAIWRYENAIRTLLHTRKFIDSYQFALTGGEQDEDEDETDDDEEHEE